jgi:iron(III) transport system ATP-binding protein
MKAASIEFRNVTKRYGDVVAVSDISFQIAPATLVTLLGPSGCGKTTTLRLIAGLELPTTGTIHIGEADVTQTPAAERDVSMVFQSYALFPHMSVLENVRYGWSCPESAKRRRMSARVPRWRPSASEASTRGFRPSFPAGSNSGSRLRVRWCWSRRCCCSTSRLSNLDARLRRQMREEIRDLQRRLSLTVSM